MYCPQLRDAKCFTSRIFLARWRVSGHDESAYPSSCRRLSLPRYASSCAGIHLEALTVRYLNGNSFEMLKQHTAINVWLIAQCPRPRLRKFEYVSTSTSDNWACGETWLFLSGSYPASMGCSQLRSVELSSDYRMMTVSLGIESGDIASRLVKLKATTALSFTQSPADKRHSQASVAR
jgi:hypothetical protein